VNDRQFLRRDIAVSVRFDDRTRFGSPIAQRADESTRQIFRHVIERIRAQGPSALAHEAADLAREALDGDDFGEIVARRDGRGWTLKDEILYPDPDLAQPMAIVFTPAGARPSFLAQISVADWPQIRGLVADLRSCGVLATELGSCPAARACLNGLVRGGLAAPRRAHPKPIRPPASPSTTHCAPLTFVGHNTVVVRAGDDAIMLDPYLFPVSPENPDRYQPLDMFDVGPISIAAITHSHPDHFDPGSLLQLGRDTTIVVPPVGRESLLAVDMERRLHQLGFESVRTLSWGESITVGALELHALPFYGEQPTDGRYMHCEEVANSGNTYVVRTPDFAAAFLADSGRDHRGDSRLVAEQWQHEHGAVDLVFSGYRGWSTYPGQLLMSSVARGALLVPREQWRSRQRIMNDADDAIDVAERFGARWLVPYGDGGAPWHWRIGLGPALEGSEAEDPDFDPLPQRVAAVAGERVRGPNGIAGSAVEVAVVRPGHGIVPGEQLDVVEVGGRHWPFAPLG